MKHPFGQIGPEYGRVEGIDGNAVLAEIAGQGLGQQVNSGLGRAVSSVPLHAALGAG